MLSLLAVITPYLIGCHASHAHKNTVHSTPSNTWAETIKKDIESAYLIYMDNHPGVLDPNTPNFSRTLQEARSQALKFAHQESTRKSYNDALATFSAVLSDGHALIYPNHEHTQRGVEHWPGFVVAWRGDKLFIHSSEREDLTPGLQILSCDDTPIHDYLEAHLPLIYARPKEPGAWWFKTPLLFTHNDLSIHPRIQSCDVMDSTQQKRHVELTWSASPEDLHERIRNATDGERTPIGLQKKAGNIYWISLPNFSPDQQEQQAYKQLFEALDENQEDLHQSRAIIIDLRHNSGGSSRWGVKVAEHLWGASLVEHSRRELFSETEIRWRVSRGNISYMQDDLLEVVKGYGDDRVTQQVTELIEHLKQAERQSLPYYTQKKSLSTSSSSTTTHANKFHAPVYVLTSGRCASACLDAVDIFTLFKNVKLVGAPTSADSIYMEVRSQPLPTGQGTIVIPMKMWANRPRRSGDYFSPHIQVNQLDWSNATFLDVVQQDLPSN